MNLTGYFLMAKHAARILIEQGIDEPAREIARLPYCDATRVIGSLAPPLRVRYTPPRLSSVQPA